MAGDENSQDAFVERRQSVIVVNDIGVILRIQGHVFESTQIYEPMGAGAISILRQSVAFHLQGMGAIVLGKLMADALMKVPQSELGQRLPNPTKWLVNVLAAQSRQFSNFHPPARPVALPHSRVVPGYIKP